MYLNQLCHLTHSLASVLFSGSCNYVITPQQKVTHFCMPVSFAK
jgi:hypothetical protein